MDNKMPNPVQIQQMMQHILGRLQPQAMLGTQGPPQGEWTPNQGDFPPQPVGGGASFGSVLNFQDQQVGRAARGDPLAAGMPQAAGGNVPNLAVPGMMSAVPPPGVSAGPGEPSFASILEGQDRVIRQLQQETALRQAPSPLQQYAGDPVATPQVGIAPPSGLVNNMEAGDRQLPTGPVGAQIDRFGQPREPFDTTSAAMGQDPNTAGLPDGRLIPEQDRDDDLGMAIDRWTPLGKNGRGMTHSPTGAEDIPSTHDSRALAQRVPTPGEVGQLRKIMEAKEERDKFNNSPEGRQLKAVAQAILHRKPIPSREQTGRPAQAGGGMGLGNPAADAQAMKDELMGSGEPAAAPVNPRHKAAMALAKANTQTHRTAANRAEGVYDDPVLKRLMEDPRRAAKKRSKTNRRLIAQPNLSFPAPRLKSEEGVAGDTGIEGRVMRGLKGPENKYPNRAKALAKMKAQAADKRDKLGDEVVRSRAGSTPSHPRHGVKQDPDTKRWESIDGNSQSQKYATALNNRIDTRVARKIEKTAMDIHRDTGVDKAEARLKASGSVLAGLNPKERAAYGLAKSKRESDDAAAKSKAENNKILALAADKKAQATADATKALAKKNASDEKWKKYESIPISETDKKKMPTGLRPKDKANRKRHNAFWGDEWHIPEPEGKIKADDSDEPGFLDWINPGHEGPNFWDPFFRDPKRQARSWTGGYNIPRDLFGLGTSNDDDGKGASGRVKRNSKSERDRAEEGRKELARIRKKLDADPAHYDGR